MKKVLIGGFLSLVGTMWGLAVTVFVGNNLTAAWSTPPGRFLTTVIEAGMTVPLLISFTFLLTGLLIMGIEYFRREIK